MLTVILQVTVTVLYSRWQPKPKRKERSGRGTSHSAFLLQDRKNPSGSLSCIITVPCQSPSLVNMISAVVLWLPLLLSLGSSYPTSLMSSTFRSLASTSLYVGRGISVSEILKSPQWPEKWPFKPEDFSRQVNNFIWFFPQNLWNFLMTRHWVGCGFTNRMRALTISSTYNLAWFITSTTVP